jgi:hypothetical protein
MFHSSGFPTTGLSNPLFVINLILFDCCVLSTQTRLRKPFRYNAIRCRPLNQFFCRNEIPTDFLRPKRTNTFATRVALTAINRELLMIFIWLNL